MDILQKEMQNPNFTWKCNYHDYISLKGKNSHGFYTVKMHGLKNDNYDVVYYQMRDYTKLIALIEQWEGENYYEFLCEMYQEEQKKLTIRKPLPKADIIGKRTLSWGL